MPSLREAPMSFRNFKATKLLHELATRPYDLTAPGALSPQRIDHFSVEVGEFKLLFGTERITDEVMAALRELAQESKAVAQMGAMQNGEVINRIEGQVSENRAVLHTAMRDLFGTPQTHSPASKAAALARKECEKLKAFIAELERKPFTDLIQIGIGGSDLGPRALYVALQAYQKKGRRVHFISNVDPDDLVTVLGGMDLKKTLVVVVSKSGTTLETLTNEAFARARFQEAGCDPKDHFISVTGEGSPMDDASRYLASFYIWDFIGGRYSATSMVGGVMLSFALGFNEFQNILRGAHEMDRIALETDVNKNLPLLSALLGIWNRNFLRHESVAILPYAQALLRFPAHLQQCDMESNGKQIDRKGQHVNFDTGPLIWGEPGTNGQHSFYQWLHQGTSIVPIEFIGFKKSQWGQDIEIEGTTSQEKLLANLFAQSIALAKGERNANPNKQFPGNRPNRILLGRQLDSFTMGALLAYYEHKIAFQGFIWEINSFDQEGVQLGKHLATSILSHFAGKRTGKRGESFPEAEALLRHLEGL